MIVITLHSCFKEEEEQKNNNFLLFHTVWFGINTIKRFSIQLLDTVMHYQKIIKSLEDVHFSHYRHETNSFQLNILSLTGQLPYKVLNPIIVCRVGVLYHSNYHVLAGCLKCAHIQLCSDKLVKPWPTVSLYSSVRLTGHTLEFSLAMFRVMPGLVTHAGQT